MILTDDEVSREDYAVTLLPPMLLLSDVLFELIEITDHLENLPSQGAIHAAAERLRTITIPGLAQRESLEQIPSDLIITADQIAGITFNGQALMLVNRLRILAAAVKLVNATGDFEEVELRR